MAITPALLADLEAITRQATCQETALAMFPPDQDPAMYFYDCLLKSANEAVYGVIRVDEGKDPSEDAVWVAITGNGPTSQANALFYTMCHDMMGEVLAELRRLYETYEPARLQHGESA